MARPFKPFLPARQRLPKLAKSRRLCRMGEFQSVRLRPLSPEIDNPTATRTATEKSAAFCPADYCAGTMAVLQSGILGLPLKQLNEGIAVTKPRGTQLLQQL